jgi:hypothetical protein
MKKYYCEYAIYSQRHGKLLSLGNNSFFCEFLAESTIEDFKRMVYAKCSDVSMPYIQIVSIVPLDTVQGL